MITEMKAGHLKDIDKPSEPFEVIGKIIPRYENENWTFTELLYEAPYLKSYQDEEDEEDEEADCLEYIDNTDKIIYLYYQDDKCVGKVKLRKNWNRYAYIEDIAVCKDFRGQGIGSALINISIEWAKHKNLHGLMLETQDNNLIACKFYHNCGFKIGSVDTMLSNAAVAFCEEGEIPPVHFKEIIFFNILKQEIINKKSFFVATLHRLPSRSSANKKLTQTA